MSGKEEYAKIEAWAAANVGADLTPRDILELRNLSLRGGFGIWLRELLTRKQGLYAELSTCDLATPQGTHLAAKLQGAIGAIDEMGSTMAEFWNREIEGEPADERPAE